MSSQNTPASGISRVAVVTGAGGGLGRAFSTALARDGWTVAALGRTLSSLSETVTACAAASAADNSPQPHSAVVCDVTDETSVVDAVRTVTDRYGRLDVLVNNAGSPGPTGRIDGVDAEAFEHTLRTNALGTFLCTREVFAWMASHGGGRIINNGSIAAHAPRAGVAAYAASKAAVASLTVSTALDGRDLGITATELDIGNARTELLSTFSSTEPMFDATEAARLLVTVADLPADVSVDAVTVTAAGMPYLGRG
ncbi:SDR family oxidoreductase [Corynebacterium variabile]|uniref:SDR family oxidoreductase n=1 Tax=Corynebacterium variabile TaxID=1727 RepID=UPI0028976FFC|nr:SDR family oxidoreductase [Corynebacterium variabile]